MKKLFNKIRSNKILIKLFSLVLIFGVLASCFIFPSAADPVLTPVHVPGDPSSVPPSDLTGYTVTVPVDWTAPAGYGLYSMNGCLRIGQPAPYPYDNLTFVSGSTLGIGYNQDLDSVSNRVGFDNVLDAEGNLQYYGTDNDSSLIFYFGEVSHNGSNDYPYVNNDDSFIQLLYNNNATFLYTGVDEIVPSDLTGYTVSVPANWTASAGYGLYSIEGTYINEYGVPFVITHSPFEPQNFGIGYHNDGSIYQLYPDEIGIHILTHAGGGRNISNGEPFSLSITGGSDTSTSSLIQWFEDNDATFAITEPSYVVPSGMYRLDIKSFPSIITTSNDLFHLYFDFSTISQDSFDGITIDTSLYNGSRYISDVYYYFPDEVQVPVILDDGSPGSPHYVTKSEGYTFIYLSEDVDLGSSENLLLFNSLFTPFSGDFDDAMLFYALGDIDGEASGYESGYLVGLDEGLSQDLGQTLLGNTLEAPMKALNSFVLYETSNGFTITLGGVIGGAICLTLFIAFLKIFAGG